MERLKEKLRMENISIEFPGVKALSDVNFELETGTIHALVGANGAGKSTLMKVLSGAHNHYTGKIFFNEKEVHIRSPKSAKELGIDLVYQEVDVALVPYLSVAENILLDEIVNSMGNKQIINWKKINNEAKSVLKQLNVSINPKKRVSELNLAEKQMVLIARAIKRKGKFLILDEPTAPLSENETNELFRVVKELAYKNNVGIIFISHRLPELFQICEKITIMRDGRVVETKLIKEMTTKKIVEGMLGNKFSETFQKKDVLIGEKIFEVKNLNDRDGKVRNVNFYVKSGEIVGIAGLVGAGKTELCKTIFGANSRESGEVILNGKKSIQKHLIIRLDKESHLSLKKDEKKVF